MAGRHRDAPGARRGGAAVRAPAGESAPAGRRAPTGEPGGATAGGGRLRQRPARARRGDDIETGERYRIHPEGNTITLELGPAETCLIV